MCTNVQGGPALAGLPYTWKTTAEDGSTYSIDKLLLDFAEQCGELAVLDKEPKLEGRHMSIFLSAKTGKAGK